MCLNVLMYYPKVDGAFCMSKPIVIDMESKDHYLPDPIPDLIGK